VQVALHDLQAPIQNAGLDPPDLASVRKRVAAAGDDQGRRDAIADLHLQLNAALGAIDLRLGKAYGVGRALADTCRNPATLEDVRGEFEPGRIATLASWLDDLASALPAHAAHSVRESVRRWSQWAHPPAEPPPAKPPAAEPPLADTLALLRRQGDLWRALLAGEKVGADMLEIGDYLDAGERLGRRLRQLGLRFARRFPLLLLIVSILFVGGIVLVVVASSSAKSDSATAIAGIGGVLASIGIGWRGAGATLGRALGGLERPLWGAELDVAITDAITLLPGQAGRPDHAGRRTLARAMADHAMTKEPHA
jgi:hypothetical protein